MGIEGMTFRHSIKSDEKGPNPSISEAGVELAHEKGATEILDEIKSSDSEVIILMGVSVFQRTRQTNHAFVEGIKQSNDSEVRVIDLDEIKNYSAEGLTIARDHILKVIQEAKGRKVVVELPLHLHSMDGNEIMEKDESQSYGPKLLREDIDVGERVIKDVPVIKPQFKEIMKRVGEGEGSPAELMIKDFLDAQEADEHFKGIDPNEAADNIIMTLRRQADAADRLMPGKKASFINVTHDSGITLAIVKLLNGGKLDRHAQEIAKGLSTETAEGFKVLLKDGQLEASFRGDTIKFSIDQYGEVN